MKSTPQAIELIRGTQAGKPLNAAIIGGGKACLNLIKILDRDRLDRLKMNILGVADPDPEAVGMRYARELNLFTTMDFRELFRLEGMNLIIELTGSDRVREEVFQSRPPRISVIDHQAARLLWDLVQTEVERAELEKARQEYEKQERKHTQVILDSLPYRIMVVNLDKHVDAVNQTFLREFGVSLEDAVGKSCYELRYGLEIPCGETGHNCFLEERFDEILEKGLISTFREYIDEDGNTRFDVVTVAPILDEEGNIIQILEASRDVTERVKLEREVQKSNTFFQNVIQSTADGIVVVDTKGNVLIFNQGMERLTGYSASEIMESGHLSSFYNIDVAKENMRKMRSDRHGPVGILNPTSMSIMTKNGEEIPVTLSASLIEINGQEVGSVGVFTDMREILKMRKDLEEAHLQLVQSEKIASVGRMASGVAHEINNPLSGILIYAEMLKEALADDQEKSQDAQEIIDQTLRCKKIVSELLEFSRQSIGKISSFSLKNLINKCLNLLINQASFQDIEVKKDIEPAMPEMLGDMGQLQQVFTNLFINAADAMEGKGRLSIASHFDKDRNHFTVRVSDTGPGIPEELKDKIFDIFFTTKPAGKGTGLGLSISQNIVNLHGGSLGFESTPGKGTTFVIDLPLEASEDRTEEESVFIGMES